ncbi:uncharacterized protein N7469_001670 [Penicillium citrinum]|uniref:Immediate-early protein n=1 Tax=Penicillium citrinum TaxID=5077 RepID=A0A9W9PHY8_PENCI|nr:uncharacterized protein N7469_001670 [Penicillium citrinum]KAJ5243343.1 hypothetical protein N7469_001670 [Penicillium citrinum]
MFSQIVTAAKGLFTRPESEEQLSTEPAGINTPTASKMVTATRQRVVEPEQPAEQPATNGVAKGGKRKAQGTSTEKTGQKQIKRRKQGDLEAAELTNGDSAGQASKSDQQGPQTTESAPKNHFRFGSEEPGMPETSLPEPTPKVSKDEEDDSDSDSDDAPETIDNSAQLLKMKEQAKRQEKLKQVEEQAKREKRRKLDERRKLQAKSTKPKELSPSDDLMSESTATLQGSSTQDTRRAALPALLPDDILNAEPAVRPPTPSTEDSVAGPKKSSKLRFLDKHEKAPKDVQVGDVTIRVLDAPSSKNSNSKPALAPRASKSGRNVRENWMNRERNSGKVNGLRRTAGGPSGFVRR